MTLRLYSDTTMQRAEVLLAVLESQDWSRADKLEAIRQEIDSAYRRGLRTENTSSALRSEEP